MVSIVNEVAGWSVRPHAWLALAMSALGLELAAVYFQYPGQLDPCVLCIYERVAVLGILVAGLLVATAPRQSAVRWIGLALWGGSSVWGLYLALKHVGIQFSDELDFSCNFFADFPSWAPLDRWWPAMFQPTGTCDDIQWQFVGLSMPQWMVVIFSLYLIAFALVTATQFGRNKRQILAP